MTDPLDALRAADEARTPGPRDDAPPSCTLCGYGEQFDHHRNQRVKGYHPFFQPQVPEGRRVTLTRTTIVKTVGVPDATPAKPLSLVQIMLASAPQRLAHGCTCPGRQTAGQWWVAGDCRVHGIWLDTYTEQLRRQS